jgi:replicative DNA helicase
VEPDHLLDRAETLIFDIASRKIKRDAVAMKDIIKSSIEMIDALYQRKGMITGLPTGFLELDQQLAGLQPAELVVVAGRPAMGKSSLSLSIAEHGYVMENGRIVLEGSAAALRENADIKEFYLGLTEVGARKSYRDVKHYKRRKRWLS